MNITLPTNDGGQVTFDATNAVYSSAASSPPPPPPPPPAPSPVSAAHIVILGDSHTRGTGGAAPVCFANGSRAMPALGALSSSGMVVHGYSDATIQAGTACSIRWDGTKLFCKLSSDVEGPGVPLVEGSRSGGYITLTGGDGIHAGKQVVLYTRQRFAAAAPPSTVNVTLAGGSSQVPHVNQQAFDSWLSFLFAKEGYGNYSITNFAVSGDSSYDQRMGCLAAAAALAPRVAFIRSGYNDNSDESLAQQGNAPATGRPSENIATMVDTMLAAGAFVVLALPVWVVNQHTSSARGYYGQMMLNAALRKAFHGNPRVALVESYQALLDYSATAVIGGSGNPAPQPVMAAQLAYFKPDQVHPSLLGTWTEYQHYAAAVAGPLSFLLPRRRAQPRHPGERSPSTLEASAVSNYGGNPMGNPLGMIAQMRTGFRRFAGSTSLTLSAGAVPGDWTLIGSGVAPATLNVYPTDHANAGTHPENDPSRALRFEVAAGAGLTSLTLVPMDSSYIVADVLGGAATMQGKRARLSCQIRMTSMVKFDSLTIKCAFIGTIGGVAGSVMEVILASVDNNNTMPAGKTIADTGILQLASPEFTIPLSLTGVLPRIAFSVQSSGTVNLDVFPMVLEIQ